MRLYNGKKYKKAYDILDKHNPMIELRHKFDVTYQYRKADFIKFCRRFQLSADECTELEELVRRKPLKKVANNRLSHLLNRIENLEKILIDDETETSDRWKNQSHILENYIFNRYMEDENVQLATEMLIMDCMNLLKKVHKQWGKSFGFYKGINLRNIMVHQDILIRNICEWFDPTDLPRDVVRRVIEFSKDKIFINNILSLFKKANEDSSEFAKLLKSEGKENGLVNEENIPLEKYKKYVKLLRFPVKDIPLLKEQDENIVTEISSK